MSMIYIIKTVMQICVNYAKSCSGKVLVPVLLEGLQRPVVITPPALVRSVEFRWSLEKCSRKLQVSNTYNQ